MATETSDLLAAAAPPTIAVVRGVADDQLHLPTPCRDYSVRDLLNHLFEVVVNFRDLAAKRPVTWAEKQDFLTDDWRSRFEVETERLIAAWADPTSLEGVSPGMGMPQTMVGGMVLLDFTVHGWDLAVATGRPYAPAPQATVALQQLTEELGPTARQMGVFAEPVPTGPAVPDLDRLLGLTGRDPRWTAVG
ncbi:TIGR03086 family protein [Micromonospora musae]|uniref:TIGR03086 family protein n=1 Tax=Micromonospora musae TaxID=1894970 RepID=A0A3A9Y2B3_9ACTN|nr:MULTISPECIES: TIGR03086 family metal-binding protein [Micromonospora]RKN24100.1 TIGR03086 family protein [Micromonospora musae]RKN31581.1 TIGR03086 family protein [Micromonospora musae]TYC06527.1 TIGR03086 family protein [Micromonospora sp. WP24]